MPDRELLEIAFKAGYMRGFIKHPADPLSEETTEFLKREFDNWFDQGMTLMIAMASPQPPRGCRKDSLSETCAVCGHPEFCPYNRR